MPTWTNICEYGPPALEGTGFKLAGEPGHEPLGPDLDARRWAANEDVDRLDRCGASMVPASRPVGAGIACGTIHMVDPDPEARETVLRLLGEAGHDVVGHDDGAALFAATLGPRSCILFNLDTAPEDGLRLLPRLRLRHPGVSVIAMAFRPDIPTAVAALKRGACDFVAKPFSRRLLRAAVDRALERRRPAPGPASEREARAKIALARLSRLELDVLRGLAAGASSRELAEAAGLSPQAIDMHRVGLLRKLDVCRLADALRVSYDAGLVPDRRRA